MNTRSIRFRLVAWYAGLLIAVFIFLGLLIYAGLKLYLEQSLATTQLRRARQISETLLSNVSRTGEAHVTNEINAWFAPETSDRFIRITRQDGSTLYTSQTPRDSSFDASHIPPPPTLIPIPGSWRKESTADGKKLLIASVPAFSNDNRQFIVEVGASLEPIHAILHRSTLMFALALAAMVVVAAAGGYLLVGKALAPVNEISRSAEQITLHNLKERLPIARTAAELEALSLSLNRMIARLDDSFEQNRRFIADASHELRTPLTIMRGELESIIEQTGSVPEVRATAGTILEEVERLGRIVEGLFAISRLDAGEAQKECIEFDLAELASTTSDQMCLLAEDKGISISCEASRQVPVAGDRARIKQIIVNLLDNAIKYTQPGGRVCLSVGTFEGRARLEVEDNGIGIPTEAQPHIFERFFRVDKARSREMGGAGLGLSIVKSICAAHGGRVEFQSIEGAGSRFRVELPLNGRSRLDQHTT